MTIRRGFALLPLLLFQTDTGWTRTPEWAVHDTQRLEGRILRVVCTGSGPSVGFARQNALDSCRSSAAQQISSDLSVKSMSISSEREVAFQQEVSNHTRVSGLACVPRREEIEQGEAEVKLWLLCDFDLSKAKAEANHRPESVMEIGSGPSPGSYVIDEERKVLTITSIPGCSDLIVRGVGPARIIPCDRNPMAIVLRPGDGELTLRARGYLPRVIFLGPKREARGYVQVALEPNY